MRGWAGVGGEVVEEVVVVDLFVAPRLPWWEERDWSECEVWVVRMERCARLMW